MKHLRSLSVLSVTAALALTLGACSAGPAAPEDTDTGTTVFPVTLQVLGADGPLVIDEEPQRIVAVPQIASSPSPPVPRTPR